MEKTASEPSEQAPELVANTLPGHYRLFLAREQENKAIVNWQLNCRNITCDIRNTLSEDITIEQFRVRHQRHGTEIRDSSIFDNFCDIFNLFSLVGSQACCEPVRKLSIDDELAKKSCRQSIIVS